uniref:Uncharacterized protein n=1 Tax=Setaria italica TaxID=4555 RepID=K3XP50_SETIT
MRKQKHQEFQYNRHKCTPIFPHKPCNRFNIKFIPCFHIRIDLAEQQFKQQSVISFIAPKQ